MATVHFTTIIPRALNKANIESRIFTKFVHVSISKNYGQIYQSPSFTIQRIANTMLRHEALVLEAGR